MVSGWLSSSIPNQSKTNAFSENAITQETIDGNGLLFLPAAGYRSVSSFNNVGSNGYYWSSTSSSATNAYGITYDVNGRNSGNSYNRCNGWSVRLASVVE